VEIKFGAKVIDKNGETLGTIDHIVRDTWSGEIRKFVVRRSGPEKDLFLSPQDTADINGLLVKLNVSLEELRSR